MSQDKPSSSSSILAAEPRHKGTLACVVLKAKNLPNKRSIGKQDPFAVLSIGEEKQKTKPDKRGGQHPQWDEQLHFEIYDDAEEAINASSSSASATVVRKAGKKVLKVACYADDNKEPDFIGDGLVDLTDVLKSGEFDEWVTIRHKDRYCGEVYLELTFFSAAPRPKRVAKQTRPTMDPIPGGSTYGGAGTFSADVGDDFGPPRPDHQQRNAYTALPPVMRPGGHRHGLSTSSSNTGGMYRQPYADEPAPGMRPSQSLAGMAATYTPPYAPAAALQQRPVSPQPPPLPPQGYPGHQRLSSSATMPTVDNRRRHSAVGSDVSGYAAPYVSGPSGAPSSYTHSFQGATAIPSSYSAATIRPGSTQPSVEDALNDLIRPMSSMSVGSLANVNRPMQPATPTTPYHQADYHYGPSAPPSSQPLSQWEQQRQPPCRDERPSSIRTSSYSYAGPSPTPPPPSQSAPPQMPYSHSSHHLPYAQQSPPRGDTYHYQQQQQVHPAQTFVPATLGHSLNYPAAPVQDPRYRPTSPALPPARPVSSSSYHALPPVPPQVPPAGYMAPLPQPQSYQGQAPPHYHSQQQQQQPYRAEYQQGRVPSPAPYQPSSSYYAPQQHGGYVDQPPERSEPQTYRPRAQYSRSPSPSKPGPPPSVHSSSAFQDAYHQQDAQYQQQPHPSSSNDYDRYTQETGSAPVDHYITGPTSQNGGGNNGEYTSHHRCQQSQPPPPPQVVTPHHRLHQEQSQAYPYGTPSPYDRGPSPGPGPAATAPPPPPPQYQHQHHQHHQQSSYYEQRPHSPQPPRPLSSQGGGAGSISTTAAPASQLLNSYPSGPVHAQQQQHQQYQEHQQQQQQQQQMYYR